MKKLNLLILLFVFIMATGCFKEENKKEIDGYLSLEGETEIELFTNDSYIEPGYKAENFEKENLTNIVEVSGWNYDTSKAGEYELVYKIKDSNSEKATAVRKIKVINFIENKKTTESGIVIKESFSGIVTGFGADIDKNRKNIAVEGNCFKEFINGSCISAGDVQEVDQICEYDYDKFKTEIDKKKNIHIAYPYQIVNWGNADKKAEEALKNSGNRLIFIGIKRDPVYKYYLSDVKLKKDSYDYYKQYNAYGFYKMYGNSYLNYVITGGATIFYQEYIVSGMSSSEIEEYRNELIKSWRRLWSTDNSEKLEVIYDKFEKYPKTDIREKVTETLVAIGFSGSGIRNIKEVSRKQREYVLNSANEMKTADLTGVFDTYARLNTTLQLDEVENWNSFFYNTEEIIRRVEKMKKVQSDLVIMMSDGKLSPLNNSTEAKFIEECGSAVKEIDEIIGNKMYGYKNYFNEVPNFDENPYQELYDRYNNF